MGLTQGEHPEEKCMMVAAFYLGLAAIVTGVYWLIGRDIDRAGAAPAADRKNVVTKTR
jgi:hypothetical protein